jgi:hypothetical protein
MQPTSRDGKSEMKRAEAIFKFELPFALPIPSVGHAAVINIKFESGLRGTALDFRSQDWFKLGHGSSSCCLDHACITADGKNADVKFHLPIGLFSGWDSQTETPGWPHRSCVRVDRSNESVTYFDRCVELSPQQYRIVKFYVGCQSQRGAVPDYKLYNSDVGAADLKVAISRIRRAFRETAAKIPIETVSEAANVLVDALFPSKTPGIGYSLGRPELFQMK